MAASSERDQRTEAPSAKRLREAAQRGDVLQSRELGTAVIVLAGAAWIALAGPWLIAGCQQMMRRGLSFDAADIADFAPGRVIAQAFWPMALPIGSLFAVMLAATVGAPALLGSLGFRWSAIGFRADKLNPLAGLRRIFGPQGLIEFGKSFAKVAVLGGLAWWLLRGRWSEIMGLGRQDLIAALGDIGHLFTVSVLVMALGLGAIAAIDVPFQIRQRGARLRMTKQEVKDEHKETDGSPETKSRVRGKQRAMLNASTRKALREATVVLTNPTHFAVALRYRPGFDAAPIVVARGKDETAAAIRELANDNAVPLLSYPQLTRAIYYTSRAGEVIREDLYIAVATILAFVFNLDRAVAEGIVQPTIEVPAEARFDEHGQADRG